MSRILSAEQVAHATRRTERVYSVLARVYDGFFDWALGPGRRYAVRRCSRTAHGIPRDGRRLRPLRAELCVPVWPI